MTPTPTRSTRRSRVAALLLTGLLAATAADVLTPDTSSVSAAPAVLPAPTGLKAVRDTSNLNDFVISWNPVAGALDHYNVSVFQNGTDNVTTVPAGTTGLAVKGTTLDTTYRITVSTRDVNGDGTTTGYYWLYPVRPGAVTALVVGRDSTATTVNAVWGAPVRAGYSPVTGYHVTITRMVDSVIVLDRTSPDMKVSLPQVDPSRAYSVKVAAINAQGAGPAGSAIINSDRPDKPTGVVAARDAQNPGVVHVKWVAPVVTGAGPIVRYEVVYGYGSLVNTLPVDTSSADVLLESARNGMVAVRACNANGCGFISTNVAVLATGRKAAPATATTNASVLVSYANGVVDVQTTGVVGSTLLYPRLVVRIMPTIANGGFRDTQWGQNGATVLTFRTVPAGNYTLTVSGVTPKGAEVELARKVFVTEGYGTLSAAEWKLIQGKATIDTGVIDMPVVGENRVMSVKPLATPDMVLTTDATLRSGWGYGVWFRASVDASNRVNGYTFQYDPMYGNAFIIRHWYNNSECGTPLARVSFPAGFVINGEHRLVVVAKGDTVWASVDGREVFRLNSLSTAIAASPCHYPAPTGKNIGFRTWNTSSAIFKNTTLS